MRFELSELMNEWPLCVCFSFRNNAQPVRTDRIIQRDIQAFKLNPESILLILDSKGFEFIALPRMDHAEIGRIRVIKGSSTHLPNEITLSSQKARLPTKHILIGHSFGLPFPYE